MKRVLLFAGVVGVSVMVLMFLSPLVSFKNRRTNGATTTNNFPRTATTVTIGFAGDTMLGRGVNEIIKEKGFNYLWGNVLPLLHKNDLNIINLETTLTRSEQAVPKVFNFKSEPEHVQALVNARIDLVSLANNHSKDFDDEGLIETIQTLNQAGIKHVGAGKNITQARKPVMFTKNGIRIGVIGATDNTPDWKAQKDKAGTNFFAINKLDQLISDVTALKEQVDLVIVTLHWGPNMRERPSQDFITAAHAMVDAGADIIHGHSSHIFQGIEIYNKKLIMYDTGDFVDDYRIDEQLRNDRSFLFLVTVDTTGPKHVQLIPTLIDNMQVNLATGADRNWSLERMKVLSRELGTAINEETTIE